jgi:predicted phosphodiesterase
VSARRSREPRIARLGVIGDVHTELARLHGALAHFTSLGLDKIACTGDLPDGPLDARSVDACCAALIRGQVLTVSGNHDRWLQDGDMRELKGATDPSELSAETSEFLAGLPATLEFETVSGRLLLCHGLGPNDMASVQPYDHGHALEANDALQTLLREARYRYVISGHTHRQMVRTIAGLTIINAGTLLRDHNPCCAVADFEARQIQYYAIADDGSCSLSSEASL